MPIECASNSYTRYSFTHCKALEISYFWRCFSSLVYVCVLGNLKESRPDIAKEWDEKYSLADEK